MPLLKVKYLTTTSASALAFFALGAVAHADETWNGMDETNRFQLQMVTEIFDGADDFSHSQTAAVARVRKDNQSYTLLNFGDGSVAIESQHMTSVSSFQNTSGVEAEFIYDYDEKRLSGDNDAAAYFNASVRPYLADLPALGRDQTFETRVSMSDLNAAVTASDDVDIEVSRDYFDYRGQDLVLLRYRVPVFSYTAPTGAEVVQWGEGVALSDPGFGEIYWTASVIRAVAEEGGVQRPYRYAKTMAATGEDGKILVDPNFIPETEKLVQRFYSPSRNEMMGFVDTMFKPDQSPIILAANLDVMALAIAEGGANDSPMISAQHTTGNNGTEVEDKTVLEFVGDLYSAAKAPLKKAKEANDLIYTYTGIDTRSELKDASERFKKFSNRYDQIDTAEKFIKTGLNVYTATTTDLSQGQDLPLTGKYTTDADFNKNSNSILKDIRKTYDKITKFEKLWDDFQNGKISRDELISKGKGKALDRLKLYAKGAVAGGDIYISGKGVYDTERDVWARNELGRELQDQYSEKLRERAKRNADEYVTGLIYTNDDPYNDGYDLYHPNWDKETNNWRVGSWQWQQDQERRKAEADQNKPKRTVTPSLGGGPSYPTAVRRPEPDVQEPVDDLSFDDEFGDLDDWWFTETDADIYKRELDAYQTELLAALQAEQAKRDAERAKRIQEGKDNPIGFDPVEFDPPTWTPPTFEPPVWVPPEFDFPEFDDPLYSIIDFTQFDGSEDDHWLGFASVMAYQFGDMSGKVATDLSAWEDFIAKYGMRKLERLALQAGYPNLASALADWESLVGHANDSGYRQWAMQQPVCHFACANIQGQWTMKRSKVALGDLLNDSRDLISTAGLSDISIGSLLLTIFIQDFAIEDGDAIRVIVSQFGREVFNSSFVLTNAGQTINVPVRPGVASVEFIALNEGELPPNTAAVAVEGVTDGDGDQEYSLSEGETGTLRVNVRD